MFKQFLIESVNYRPKHGGYYRPIEDNDRLKKTLLQRGEFEDYHATLKPSHLEALKSYKNNSSSFNEQLRYGLDHDYKEKISKLDEITSHPVEQSFHVYRGIRNEFSPSQLKTGRLIHDKGFTSTTLDPDISTIFSRKKKHSNPNIYQNIISKIYVPAGTKGHLLDMPDVMLRDEQEFLLRRGTHFKVLGHSLHHDRTKHLIHVVHMKVLHQDDI